MFWLTALGVVAFLLVLAGILGVHLTVRRYRLRLEKNRTRALIEMMKIVQGKMAEKETGESQS